MGVAACSRRNRQARNEDAVGLGGWTLQDRQLSMTVDLALSATAPTLRIAVVDGMGGRPAGDAAAVTVAGVLSAAPSPGDARPRLTVAFERADEALRSTATDQTRGMGCTAALVEVSADGRARIGNVGDVRVYRVVEGYLGQLTRDDRASDAGRRQDGRVTQWIGGLHPTFLDAHEYAVHLRQDDLLVVTTDGVHDALDLADAWPSEVSGPLAQTLVDRAAAVGAHDNLTAVTLTVLDVVPEPTR
jgi:serine/threonine protein phosphatase PrpC